MGETLLGNAFARTSVVVSLFLAWNMFLPGKSYFLAQMQYLTLVDFLAEITYRKKTCLSVFDYYGIFKPSPSYVNLVIYTHTHKRQTTSQKILHLSMMMLYS